MRILDLTGIWSLRQRGGDEIPEVSAEVPGGVHPALISAGVIPDPGVADNIEKLKWVGERDWIFERPFDVDAKMLTHDIVDIEFDGIDTVAEVFVNEVPVLKADDLFRRWHADVKPVLHEGENKVRVEIASPCRSAEGMRIRKAQYGFGSEYSPECLTAGICRPVRIRAWNEARLCDLGFSQRHDDDAVSVFIGGWIEIAGDDFSGLEIRFAISGPDGHEVWRGEGTLPKNGDGAFNCVAALDSPRLWWPNGMGEQPLYTVTSVLRNSTGAELDKITQRIGLRTLVVDVGDDGTARLTCNGRNVFLKGGVWIPPGLFPAHVAAEDYAFLIGSAVEANLNAFRIWDGGTFEDEAFWEMCDESGMIVTGVSDIGPESDDAGDDGIGMFRLLQHACLPDGLLCEPGEDNGLCVVRGPLSYPVPETVESCVPRADRNITGQAMEARVSGQGGAADLIASLARKWPVPSSFSDWLWLSQIAQGAEVCAAIAEKRRDPRCSGVMWEPYASCWAMADGSSIDGFGRWKALHYLAQNAFAPVSVSGAETEAGAVEVSVSNTGLVPWEVKLAWRATSMSGMVIDEGEASLVSEPGCVVQSRTLDLSSVLKHYTRQNVVVWLAITDEEGFTLSRSHVLFAPPKHLALENPCIAVDIDDTLVVEGEEAFKVTLTSASPAFWVWLDLPGEQAQYSDNFVCLEPDEPLEIYVSTVNPMTQFAFRKKLNVRSLYDIKVNGGASS